MDSGDVSLPAPVPSLPGAPPPTAPAHSPGANENPFGEPSRTDSKAQGLRKRIGSALAALAALGAKFWAVIKGALIFLPKLKLLTTAGTALISVVVYSLFFGWTFAFGFVLLLLIHEMGHVIQLRREGVRASAPMFIPMLGAVVMMKSMPDDALAEARVGLAGPILGTAGSAACLAIGEATDSDLLRALAYVGFLLNLINLVPLTPFDGGRAMAAMAPAMWFVGLGVMVALLLITGNTFLLIFIVLGGLDTWRRWQARRTRSLEQAAYYRVSSRARLLVGAVYLGLIAVLVAGMEQAYVLSSGGHTFGHF
ncbi:MAG TPA: site-2 protease family protein [Solirubrobacteraceae bacterium]|nr:site-2 protease family protein [Solirubrobacteraceae bacterium]